MERDHEAVRGSYERLAGRYDRRWAEYIAATHARALEAVRLREGERLLDVACGTGVLLEGVQERYPSARCVGLDLSAAMLGRAQRRCPWAALLRAEASRLPFADGTFNAAVCLSSFHYFRRPRRALREVGRVLKPGGQLVLVDWCGDDWVSWLIGWWLRFRDPAHHRLYTVRRCRALLESEGFVVREQMRFRAGVWGMMRFVCAGAT